MYIDLSDARLHVEVSGPDDAPIVLLMHSLATDLSVWDHLVAAAPGCRFARFDLRGHGGSDATAPPYDLDQLVGDAVGVLDGLGAERAHVVGLSIGAMIAMGMALDHPQRVGRLVVADARADAPAAYVDMWSAAIARVDDGDLDGVIAGSMERWFTAATRQQRPELIAATTQQARRTSPQGFVGCARAIQALAYLDRLGSISTPTLFVTGELDPAAPPATMRAMTDRVAGARLEVIPGAAHLTPLEAPSEFNRLVVEFLGEPAAAATPLAPQGAHQ